MQVLELASVAHPISIFKKVLPIYIKFLAFDF